MRKNCLTKSAVSLSLAFGLSVGAFSPAMADSAGPRKSPSLTLGSSYQRLAGLGESGEAGRAYDNSLEHGSPAGVAAKSQASEGGKPAPPAPPSRPATAGVPGPQANRQIASSSQDVGLGVGLWLLGGVVGAVAGVVLAGAIASTLWVTIPLGIAGWIIGGHLLPKIFGY